MLVKFTKERLDDKCIKRRTENFGKKNFLRNSSKSSAPIKESNFGTISKLDIKTT